MQKWKCRLRRGMALALAAMVIGGGTSIMTMPVSAENETVNTDIVPEMLKILNS